MVECRNWYSLIHHTYSYTRINYMYTICKINYRMPTYLTNFRYIYNYITLLRLRSPAIINSFRAHKFTILESHNTGQ